MDVVKRTTEKRGAGTGGRTRGAGFKLLLLLLGLMSFWLATASLAYLSVNSSPVQNRFAAAPQYELEYHANTGASLASVTVPATQRNYTGRFTVSTEIPTRSGYRFTGWNLSADGSGETLAGGADYMATALHTDLYAQWVEADYTLYYNANGGSNAPALQKAEASGDSHVFTVADHAEMQPPTVNQIFLGWADTADAKIPVYAYGGLDHEGNETLQDSVTVTADMENRSKTLYAVWGTWYTLRFDANTALGGYGNVPQTQGPVLSAEDSYTFRIPEKTEDNTPKRDGLYEFGWWGTAPDVFIETEYKHGSGITLFKENSDRTLYAFYRPLAPAMLSFYWNRSADDTEKYNEQSGTGTDNVTPITIGIADPNRKDCRFLGWAESPDATEADYVCGDTVMINRIQNYEKKLYAVWQPLHRFSVSFVYNADTFYKFGQNEVFWLDNGNWTARWLNSDVVTATNGERVLSYWRFVSDLTDETSYTFDTAFWKKNGVYANRLNVKIADYEFLGWSTDPNATEPMYTVGADKCIEQDIVLSCTGGDCGAGKDHQLVLFAVWKTIPKHYYRLVFSANNGDETVVNKVTGQRSEHPLTDYDTIDGGNRIVSMLCPDGDAVSKYSTTDGDTTDIHDSGSSLLTDGVDSRTWTKKELNASGPLASKSSTTTARYALVGWSFERKMGWETVNVDVPVDENGEFLGDITIAHSAAYDKPTAVTDAAGNLTVYTPEHPGSGEGSGHNLILFPVWKSVPLHQFKVYFTGDSSDVTLHYYNAQNGAWESGVTNFNFWPEIDIYDQRSSLIYYSKTLPDESYVISSDVLAAEQGPPTEWTESFWTSMGYYANRRDDPTTRYEFLGWCYKPRVDAWGKYHYDQVDIEVDEEGFLKTAPSFDDLTDNCNSSDAGAVHVIVLRPVWKKIPLNSYRLIFVGNDGDVKYWEDGEPRQTFQTTLMHAGWQPLVYPNGSTGTTNLHYSRAHEYVTNPELVEQARSYTWPASFWKTHGESAIRADTDTTRYVFKGWSYNVNNKPSSSLTAADVNIPVDANGFITQDITITDPWNHTDEGHLFSAVLWAVWEEEEIHSYQLRFNRNSSNSYVFDNITYFDEGRGYWRGADNGWPVTYTSEKLTRDRASYTWDTAFWNTHGLHALKGSEGNYDFVFLGWAKDPEAVIPDYPVEWRTENGEKRGYITQDIRVDEPDAPCVGGVHVLNLYAVFGRVPKTRTYTLSFDSNNGTGAPGAITQTETFNGTAWAESSQPFTIPLDKPSSGQRLFVGWSENREASQGSYGYPYEGEGPAHDATRQLQSSYSFPYGDDGKKTLYAIYWNEYRLYYDGNADGDEVTAIPADELAYWSSNVDSYEFSVNSFVIPQRAGYRFLGWATSANATAPQYGTGGDGLPTKIDITAGGDGTGSATLYAVWEPLGGTNNQTASAPQTQEMTLLEALVPVPQKDAAPAGQASDETQTPDDESETLADEAAPPGENAQEEAAPPPESPAEEQPPETDG